MELQFTKSGSVYVAEAMVNKPYNLHLERAEGGMFMICQRGTESGLTPHTSTGAGSWKDCSPPMSGRGWRNEQGVDAVLRGDGHHLLRHLDACGTGECHALHGDNVHPDKLLHGTMAHIH